MTDNTLIDTTGPQRTRQPEQESDRFTHPGNGLGGTVPTAGLFGALRGRRSFALQRRANAPVRAATMLSAQQSYGNRAVQRQVYSNPIWNEQRKMPHTAPWLTPARAQPEWKFPSIWPARISGPSVNSPAEEEPTPAPAEQLVAPAQPILARWPYTRSGPGKMPNPSMLEEEPTP